MEDNNVYVNIKINTNDLKLGTKEVSSAIARTAQDMAKYGKIAQASCDSAANAFIKQNQAVANTAAEVDKLTAKLADAKSQKVKTSFLTDEEDALKTLLSERSKLGDKKLALEMSGKADTEKYAETVDLLRDINREIERQQNLLASLKNDPRSYTNVDTSVIEEKLTMAKQKHAAAVNNASLAYQKFDNAVTNAHEKLAKTTATVNEASKSTFNLNRSFKKGFTTILKYGFGLRSLYVAWRKVRQAVIEGVNTLAKEDDVINQSLSGVKTQLNTLKNSFAAAFAPLINLVAPIIENFLKKLNALMQDLSKFIALLTGASSYKVATTQQIDYAKSLENTGKAAKKTAKYLSSLDEIKTFTEKDSSGGGAGGNSFMDMPLFEDQRFAQMKKRIDELKKAFKEGWDYGFKSDKLPAILDNFNRIKKTLAEIWKNPELTEARHDYEDSLARMVGTVSGAAASIGVSLTYGVSNGVADALEDSAPFITEKATNIYKSLTEANDSVSDFAASLSEIAATVFESDSFSEIVEKITEFGIWATGNACDALVGFFKDEVKYFLDPISANGEDIANVLQDIVDILDLLLPNMDKFHSWNYNESGFHKWLQEMTSQKADELHNKLQTLHDKLQLVKDIMQEIKNQGGLKEWFKANFSWDPVIRGAAQGFLNGLYMVINSIIDALNSLTMANARQALNTVTGGKLGWIGERIPRLQVPQLAKGAVIPPNAPFLATLGDQRSGNNFEAPEGLLRQVVREESGSGSYQFTAQINRRVLFDEIISEAKIRQSASGRNPFEFA